MRRVLATIAAVAVGVSGLLVAILVLAEGDSDRSGPEGLLGPGSAIGDGFTVAGGSTLLGSRFPQVMSTYRGMPRLGWTAVLLVEGDPGEVLRAYVAQSESQGMGIGTLGVTTCFRAGSLIECSISREAGPQDAPAGRSIYATLVRSEAGVSGPFAAHLLLKYESWGDPSLFPHEAVGSTPDVSAATGSVSFGPPSREPKLARTGEPIIDPRYAPDRRVITVEDGSELLAPPAPDVCGTGGYQGVFRVTGDPRDVVERYAQQFTEKLGPGEQGFQGRVRDVKRDVLEVLEARWGQSGGGTLMAIAVTLPDGDSYLTIERCAD